MKHLKFLVLAVALFATACGSSNGDSELVLALAAEITAGDDALTADREEALCFSSGTVDGIGEDRMTELGVTTENVGPIDDIAFTEAEAELLVNAMFDCLDVTAMMADSLAEDFGEEGGECVADALDEATLRGFFSGAFSGKRAEPGTDVMAAIFAAMGECDIAL